MSLNNKFTVLKYLIVKHGFQKAVFFSICYKLIPGNLLSNIHYFKSITENFGHEDKICKVYDADDTQSVVSEQEKYGVYDLEKDKGSSFQRTKLKNINKITWFVPDWTNVWGGGHYTLFRFAHFFETKGIENEIFIYDNHRHLNGESLEHDLRKALPNCRMKVIVEPDKLTATDVAIATTWQSAYSVKAFKEAAFKFYFMQDYESLFYASGTQALQADYSYRFGFLGITGGLWLRSIYEGYGNKAEHYTFATDREIFYPGSEKREKIKKVFFYGRPSTPRRAFELGMASLQLIKQHYPDVEIVIAGLDGLSKPSFEATMLGNLTLKQTGELYRSCDVGIALSATNLSYLPVELMASGCPVISNSGPCVEWFCKNNENALIAEPTPQGFLSRFQDLYESNSLRQKLIENGLKTTSQRTWESEMDKIFQYIVSNIVA